MHTESNVLIEISPHLRIPRTYKRFAGLMGAWPDAPLALSRRRACGC